MYRHALVTEDLTTTDNNEDDCDLNADNECAMLEPTLTFTELDSSTGPSVDELATHLGQHPSALEITDVITKAIPLNAKQKWSVSMLFYHVLRCQGKTTINLEDQFFLYVGSKSGVGKSRVIEAVRLGLRLLQRDKEAIVLAPTGNAASGVEGSIQNICTFNEI
jgi:hypothetical protein